MMVDSDGLTTLFSWPFCSVLPAQTSMMCSLMLRDIEVLLYHSTHQFQDIVVIKDKILYAIELTVCFETNFEIRNYKINRYKNLSNKVVENYAVRKLFLEMSSIGFYTNNTKPLIKFLREIKTDDKERMLRKCSEVAIRASFRLNIRKNKEWLSPKLLTFV